MTIDKEVHWRFHSEYERQMREAFVAVLTGARVWGRDGAVITPDNRLLEDVSHEIGRFGNDHPIFFKWKLPPIRKIGGTVALIAGSGSDGYFHWMFDILPRFDLLRRSGIAVDGYIVGRRSFPFQVETLAKLGIRDIIECSESFHIQAERLVVPSFPGNPGHMPKWVCDFLVKEFLPEDNGRPRGDERIYISRSRAKGRRVLNEDQVFDILEQYGFQKMTLEAMPVAEQAKLFSAASVVVAPHGGGLTNLVFCRPGTKVIEIFAPNYVNVCYWALCNQVSLQYCYLLGEGPQLPQHKKPHHVLEHIRVHCDKLQKMLSFAGITGEGPRD